MLGMGTGRLAFKVQVFNTLERKMLGLGVQIPSILLLTKQALSRIYKLNRLKNNIPTFQLTRKPKKLSYQKVFGAIYPYL